ncbi:PREDICTED: indole glucosinolate O-methyltransferase 3-like [Tarenaya hassleriana]|uniref:indole glucosinolate O-methyltransferase 3-like n=1 Tax=Tarenaya hassleriana TaxID=28532 RepID=UPI00053C1638|nr:PREDICTED: indole glucosinolate O-methyltransferase 3-like [Tarenaya hassleriana]
MKDLVSQSFITNPQIKTAGDEENEVVLLAVRIANAAAFPMVLKAALELGLFDILHSTAEGSFLTPAEIACRLPTRPRNPDAPTLLDRMLRLLASYDIVACRTVHARDKDMVGEVQRVYGSKPICRFFLTSNQELGSLASQVLVHHDQVFLSTWTHLKDVVLEGGDAFSRAHGMKLFEYMGTDQRFRKIFNQSGCSTLMMKRLVEVYKGFEGVEVLVDVGGGIGTALGIITSNYPNMRGINFDIPCVIPLAPSYPRVEHVAGDMFVDVPKGDAIFMKRIIHDWTDEDSVKILKNCWKALPGKGKVVLFEIVTPTEAESGDIYANISFDMDMLMFAHCSGGKERDRAEFEALAADAGFARCEFVCRVYHCWVIELHKDAINA